MARQKQPNPLRRDASFDSMDRSSGESIIRERHINGYAKEAEQSAVNGQAVASHITPKLEGSPLQLIIGVGGIYASFLTWGVIQERITKTQYGTAAAQERFKYTIFLNTIQSTFAALTGYSYLIYSTPRSQSVPPVFPSLNIIWPLILVAITQSLASPFGLAALNNNHVDYITYVLAKSCKLVPVMALHVSIFRKKYPLHKYAIVSLVTAGVAVFTLYQPSSGKKKGSEHGSSYWGLLLLGINLLFDGITNSVQDQIFTSFNPYSGQQMQVAQNLLSTALTVMYMALSPYIALTGVGEHFGMNLSHGHGEFGQAVRFIQRHPAAGWDVLGYAACGAIGQIFIYYTLSNFDSILLVTVTVTRKMITMALSVVWFGHRLTPMQWVGVGLVFGGIGGEAAIARSEKLEKERKKRDVEDKKK